MPRFGEDVRNVVLIAGSAVVGLVATGALLTAGARTVVRVAPVVDVRIEPNETRVVEMSPVVTSGAERLYGRVETLDGRTLVGFLRWDKNEGSWADLMDAIKAEGGQTGVRFGHVARIEATGDHSAWVEMRNGESFQLRGSSTDLGRGMRALTVESLDGEFSRLTWDDLAEVEFLDAPADARSTEQRLHGRVTTRSGQSFVGFVTWDVDEIYASDILDGEADGQEMDVPFGAIASIERRGATGARVLLHDGEVLDMTGSNDVDADNGGLTVSDPDLGQIRVEWMDMATVEFFPPEVLPDRSGFDGGARIQGTVIGSSGDSWTGAVVWDRDEAWGWEILNGELDDAEFFVEFGKIARIEKNGSGSRVTLRDGRVFDLSDSNDVSRGNRGLVIEGADGVHSVSWSDFRELRIGN